MFSKSRIHEAGPGEPEAREGGETTIGGGPVEAETRETSAPRNKPAASVLSSDLTITGDIKTTGDVQVEGVVEGDIRAHLLTIGESATIKGEVMADDVVVNGRIVGRVRGLKVRLTSSARVEGDIIHKTIAIESGAHFEGSVQRQEDPLSNGSADSAAQHETRQPAQGAGQGQPGGGGRPAQTSQQTAQPQQQQSSQQQGAGHGAQQTDTTSAKG